MSVFNTFNVWAGLVITFLVLLWCVAMCGCAVKPADIDSWSNEAQASMLQFQGRVSQKLDAVNSDLDSVKATVDSVHGTIGNGLDWAQTVLYTMGVGGLGAGGLAGVNRVRKKNGTE